LDESAWCGWQFDRPDLKEGFALFPALKMSSNNFQCPPSNIRYDVSFAETFDAKQERVLTSEALRNLQIEITSAPGTMLIRYYKTKLK
jgi:hypothetical protein